MVAILQHLIDGIALGAAYALLALGFTLIFGVMRRLNLAFGPSILVGMFAGTFLFLQAKAGLWAVALATVAATVLVGLYVERLCFWAVRQGAALASMISSYAIWMQLEEATALLFPRRSYAFPPLFSAPAVEFGPFSIRPDHLVMLAVAAAAMIGLLFLMKCTRYGLAVRALSEHPEAARHLGIPVGRIAFLTFLLASAIGGVAGFLIAASQEQVTTHGGLALTFKGLIAMMLGGMGSIPGAMIGGIALGLVESSARGWLGAPYHDLAAFGLLFVLLILRPGGLFGQGIARRDAAAFARA